MSNYAWIDLETTGLDPKRCSIIEIACILTDENFVELTRWEQLVGQEGVMWEEGAFRMHLETGLAGIAQVGAPDDWGLRKLMSDTALGPWILAGSSPHFDRKFIDEHMPYLSAFLHHRHLDVSTLKMMWPELDQYPKHKGPEHRAMPDIEHSLAIARFFREVVGW